MGVGAGRGHQGNPDAWQARPNSKGHPRVTAQNQAPTPRTSSILSRRRLSTPFSHPKMAALPLNMFSAIIPRDVIFPCV